MPIQCDIEQFLEGIQDALVHANLRIGLGKGDDLQVLNKEVMFFFGVNLFRGEGIGQGDLGAFDVVEFGIQLSQLQLHHAVGGVFLGQGLQDLHGQFRLSSGLKHLCPLHFEFRHIRMLDHSGLEAFVNFLVRFE